jgi:hypothetical protein
MAHIEEETSNRLFETLQDWSELLERLSPQYEEMLKWFNQTGHI